MRAAVLALAALAGSLALSGCATKLSADDVGKLIDKTHAAGCGGSVTVDVRGGTGQLGGSASGQFTATLDCPKGISVGSVVGSGDSPLVVRQ